MKISDEQHKQVLGEVLLEKLIAIEELVAEVPTISRRLGRVEKRLKAVEVDMKITKLAVHDLSIESRKHTEQITTLSKQADYHTVQISLLSERVAAAI